MCGQCGFLLETEGQDACLVLRRTMGCVTHSTPASRTTRVGATRAGCCSRGSQHSALATATLVLLVLLSACAGAKAAAGVADTAVNSIDALEVSASRQIQQLLQQGASGVATAAQGRIGHRLRMIFPLVIAIATRLGTLVPIGLSVLGGVTLMVMFAKKAFIVSLLTLGLVLWDKWTRRPPAPPPPTFHPPPTYVHHVPSPTPTHPSWAPPHDHWPPAPPPTHAGPHWVESGHPMLHSPAHALFQGHVVSPSAVHHSYSLPSGVGGGDDDSDGGGGAFSAQGSAPVRAQRKPPAAYYPFPPQRVAALAGARRRGVGRGGPAPGARR